MSEHSTSTQVMTTTINEVDLDNQQIYNETEAVMKQRVQTLFSILMKFLTWRFLLVVKAWLENEWNGYWNFLKYNKWLIKFVLFYDFPGCVCGEPSPPPMKVTCPGLKGVESLENPPNTWFTGLLAVCLYIILLPRHNRNLRDCLCPYSHNTYTYYLVR